MPADTGAVVRKVDGWEYVAQGVVSTVSPNRGQFGTLVTISGTNLRSGANRVQQVTLAGKEAVIRNESNTQVIVVASAGPSGGLLGDVVLTSSSGSFVSLRDSFTYVQAGDIDSVLPFRGQVNTIVTITCPLYTSYAAAE